MKNSNLLQALMVGGIAIGIALAGAGLGVALDKKTTKVVGKQGSEGQQGATGKTGLKGEQGEQGLKGERGLAGRVGNQGFRGLFGRTSKWTLLNIIENLGKLDSYYTTVDLPTSPMNPILGGELFDIYLSSDNFLFRKRETVLEIGPNVAAIKIPSLFREQKTLMDGMFLILMQKNLSLVEKNPIFLERMTPDVQEDVAVAVTDNGKRAFTSKITLTITAPANITNGIDQDKKTVKFIIERNWHVKPATGQYDIKQDKIASAAIVDQAGFKTGARAKLGLPTEAAHTDWKVIATKATAGKANKNASDAIILLGVNKKTGQVAYYMAKDALAGADAGAKTTLKVGIQQPTST